MRSTISTTTETTPFINPSERVTVGVHALLELALWCRKRRDLNPGGPPCSTHQSAAVPPVFGDGCEGGHQKACLDSPLLRPETTGDPGPVSHPDSSPPAAGSAGGQA
jgi:hypothetical protein